MKESLFEALKYMGAAALFAIYLVSLDLLKEKKNISRRLSVFITIIVSLIIYIIYCVSNVGYENVGSYILGKVFSNIGSKIIMMLKFMVAAIFVAGIYSLKHLFKLVKEKPKVYAAFFLLLAAPFGYAFIRYGGEHIYNSLNVEILKYTFIDFFAIFCFLSAIVGLEHWISLKFHDKKDYILLSFIIADIYLISYCTDVYGFSSVLRNIIKFIVILVIAPLVFGFLFGGSGGKKNRSKCSGCPDEYSCTSKLGVHCPRSR
ncbi:hypothetical protein [Fusobacterium sp. PH5-44]|uniref:hypothetical protein n=1 Tax=unclassified Fusobacterium TaxID=2648384 RepID=UPI003D251613